MLEVDVSEWRRDGFDTLSEIVVLEIVFLFGRVHF